MKKIVLSSLPIEVGGPSLKISFPVYCKGEEKDALSVSFNKEAIKRITCETRAALFPVRLNNADEYAKLQSKTHQDLRKWNQYDKPISAIDSWSNNFIKLIGGYSHNENGNEYLPQLFLMVNWQHWNEYQTLFASDPTSFMLRLKSSNMMNSRLLQTMQGIRGWERAEDLDPSYFREANKYATVLDGAINPEKSRLAFVSTPYEDDVFLFDQLSLLATNSEFPCVDPITGVDLGYFNHNRFKFFKKVDYTNRNLQDHDQLTTTGQYLKLKANRNLSQSILSAAADTYDLGTITDLSNRKSASVDALSDAFAKLLSSNYAVSFRGIYSGALFLQFDDFTRTFGNTETVNYEGYLDLIKEFCGGETFLESHLVFDMNAEGQKKDAEYTRHPMFSLAREFAIVNIHTKRVYLVSIGEHRFAGQELWRHGNRTNMPRLSSSDDTTDSLVLDNKLIDDLMEFHFSKQEATVSASPPLTPNGALKHVFSTKHGRGTTSIHALDFSPCLSGAALMHSPLSSLNLETADDDKDAIQYGLNYVGVTSYKEARDYELVKAVDQTLILKDIIGGLFVAEGSVIKNVLNFNIARAVWKEGSDFLNPAIWASEKQQIIELVDNYHRHLWAATHARPEHFDVESPEHAALLPSLKSWIASKVGDGINIDSLREPILIAEKYQYMMERLMAACNELDLNHNGNIFISQSIRKYVYRDGVAEYIKNNTRMVDTTFSVYPTLHHHVLINLGDTPYMGVSHLGLPNFSTTMPRPTTNPHTLPNDDEARWPWMVTINPDYCQKLAAHLIATDHRHMGLYDNYKQINGSSDDIIVFDGNQMISDINTLRSLPLIFLSILRDREDKFYKPSNPLVDASLSIINFEKLGLTTTGDVIGSHPQTVFRFKLEDQDKGVISISHILSLLACCYGVTNMNGKTGAYLGTLSAQKYTKDGDLSSDKAPLYLRELACAIHADTGEIPCTSQMVKDLLTVNQKLFDLDFYTQSGMNPSLFDNDSKEMIIERAKTFNRTAFNRTSALFIYDSYK